MNRRFKHNKLGRMLSELFYATVLATIAWVVALTLALVVGFIHHLVGNARDEWFTIFWWAGNLSGAAAGVFLFVLRLSK